MNAEPDSVSTAKEHLTAALMMLDRLGLQHAAAYVSMALDVLARPVPTADDGGPMRVN